MFKNSLEYVQTYMIKNQFDATAVIQPLQVNCVRGQSETHEMQAYEI